MINTPAPTIEVPIEVLPDPTPALTTIDIPIFQDGESNSPRIREPETISFPKGIFRVKMCRQKIVRILISFRVILTAL
jgi:hypothetical protein